MNTTIQNNGLPNFQPAPSAGNGTAPANTSAAGTSTAAAVDGDQLKLTDSARALQEAARMDNTSAIDPKRVDSIRQALADGSYKINANNIADRMLSLEQQIGNAGKA